MPYQFTCHQCGIEYTTKKHAQKFCSRSCSYASASVSRKGKLGSNWRGGKVTIACAHCQQPFEIWPRQQATKRYCSWDCYNISRTTDVISPEARFWNIVDKTDSCWIWAGYISHGGYGRFGITRSNIVEAHRYSWELHNGPIPNGQFVLHDCPDGDNPACVNPAHLWLGTQADNVRDKVSKNRQPKGSQRSDAKLTEESVKEIRSRLDDESATQVELAKEYGVSDSAIWLVYHRKTWKHV